MVTSWVVLITAGAVYNPFDRLPTEGLMDQVKDVVELPITTAMNCLLCDAVRVAFEGLTTILTPPVVGLS